MATANGSQNVQIRCTRVARRAGPSGTPTHVSAYVEAASTPPAPPAGSGTIVDM